MPNGTTLTLPEKELLVTDSVTIPVNPPVGVECTELIGRMVQRSLDKLSLMLWRGKYRHYGFSINNEGSGYILTHSRGDTDLPETLGMIGTMLDVLHSPWELRESPSE